MRNAGFTIIELLIASTLMAVVMVVTMQVFVMNNQTYIKVDSVVDAQQSLRAVASVIERDLRHAGMMVPEGAAVCGMDSTTGPDRLYISDYTAINPAGSKVFFDGARITSPGGNKFTGTPTLALDTLVMEPDPPEPSYDTDGNGVNDSDFHVGGGVIIVDLMDLERGSDCGFVTDVDLATNSIKVDIVTAGMSGNPAAGTFDMTAVPALEYRIESASLLRNGLRLADGIEDLQITYFMDLSGDNIVDSGELRGESDSDSYLASASDASDLRWVRLNVVARTRSEDDQFTQGFIQTTENRAVGGATQDGFRRRVHTAIVRMRNVGDRAGGT
jgi:prepilin-type N-terminal cleavage/methylation domain-containing protein